MPTHSMEIAAVSATVSVVLKSVMGSLFPLLKKEYNKHKGLAQEIQFIHDELAMVAAAMDDKLSDLGRHERTAVARLYTEQILDLAHDIDDCFDRFKHHLNCKPHGSSGAVSSMAHRVAHEFKKVKSRFSYAEDIHKLKKRLKEAHERVKNSVTVACCSQQHSGLPSPSMLDFSNPRSVTRSPVGIEKPMEHLLSLLHEVEGEQQQLRVISIVGFSGLGKTTLARAVYDSRRAKETFHCRAWVSAATGNGTMANFSERIKAILRDILEQVVPNGSMDVDTDKPDASLKEYLCDKRYLIVIDDIQMIGWGTLNSAFVDYSTGSRIILTTSIQSEANKCSRGNGHVYQMDTLREEDSKEIVFQGIRSPELEYGSAALLGKCDGLPLALVSVSDYLISSNEPTGNLCANLCRNLGFHLNKMHGHDNFSDLRKVLLDNYDSLSGYALSCLLYLGIFPNNRPLRRKVIIRRWLAEGYARSESLRAEQDIADENFDRLIDWNIIRPIVTRNNSQVKTCKTHGIIHEFVLEKSLSQRFIMTPSPDHSRINASANNARHLSVHAGKLTTEYVESDEDLSRVRSLTVFGAAGGAIACIRKCKLIRVLDLEECNDLKDNDLEHICKLWHLKYLSLGDTIQVLPRCIDGLHCLETLDLRRTKIESLPIEAIQLPHLIHLFGKIMLDKDDLKNVDKWSKLKKFLSGKKSNLQTLAGFVTDDSKVFLQLINGMRKLKKVKIWCKGVANSSSYISDLSRAIQKFTEVPMDNIQNDCSFSLDLDEPSENLLSSINLEPCPEGSKYDLRSLKLNGKLLGLPPFVTLLSGLTDLCISSVTLTLDLISALANLDKLLYLKLVANLVEDFIIAHGAFPSLRRLCFQVQNLTSGLLTIQQGALPNLVSLQLLYEGLVGLSGINIRHFKQLKEVTIGDKVTAQTRQDWEQAAKKHPNRPRVIILVSTPSRIEREELAANPTQREVLESNPSESDEHGPYAMREKQKGSVAVAQPSLDDRPDSGSEHMRLSKSSPWTEAIDNPAIGTATMESSSTPIPLHAAESVPLSQVPITEAGELDFIEQTGHRLNAAEELPTNKPLMEAEEPDNDEDHSKVHIQDDQVVGDRHHENMTFTEEMDAIMVLVEQRYAEQNGILQDEGSWGTLDSSGLRILAGNNPNCM